MTASQFLIRKFMEGDEIQIVKLLEKSFPEWASRKDPLRFWRWKYKETPLGSDIILAISKDKIIGSGHRINLQFKIGESIYPLTLGDDFATHPDYRGLGVYNKIMTEIEKDRASKNSFLLSITTNPITINDQLKRGRIQFPHKIIHLMRIKSIDNYLKNKSIKNSLTIGSVLKIAKKINSITHISKIKKNNKDNDNINITDVDIFDNRINTFWDIIKDKYTFIMEKKISYLNWRYCISKFEGYIVKQAESEGKVYGYIVLQVKNKNDYKEGYIIDLLSKPDRLDIANTLLEEGCRYFDSLGIDSINYRTIKGSIYESIFINNNFMIVPDTVNMNVIIDFNNSSNELDILKTSLPNQVQFTYGDYL